MTASGLPSLRVACAGLLACGALPAGLSALSTEGEPQPTATAPAYRIAYNVLEDEEADDYEIYVMELDGYGQRNLSRHPAVDWAYVAAGDRLYLVSDRDAAKRKYFLYEMTVSDGALRRITSFLVRDSWVAVRPGGAELVVTSAKDGTPDLYLIDGSGRELRRLTDDEVADRDPAFSPDGREIVWSSSRTGIDELWLMDLTTGDARQLTHYPESARAAGEHGYHAGPPAWEPHRNVISFCSRRNGDNSIFTIHPDGSGEEQITPSGRDECWHSWSPDGRFLAYDGTDETGNYDIYLRDTRTGTTMRLTEGPKLEQAPIFLPAPSATP